MDTGDVPIGFDLTIRDVFDKDQKLSGIEIRNPSKGWIIRIADRAILNQLIGLLHIVMRENRCCGFRGSITNEDLRIDHEPQGNIWITLDDSFVTVRDDDVGRLHDLLPVRLQAMREAMS